MKILFAHSDRDFLVSFRELLAADGFEVATAFDGPRAVSLAAESAFDAAVIDARLPRLPLGAVLSAMKASGAATLVTTDAKVTRSTLNGENIANAYIEFPFTASELAELIKRTVDMKRGSEIIPCGKATVDVSAFSMSGAPLTVGEIELIRSLSSGQAFRGESVYVDSLSDKLTAADCGKRIRYILDEGYKLVDNDE